MPENDTTFVFHQEWIDNLGDISEDMKAKIIYNVCRYGCGLELEDISPVLEIYINALKGRIDFSKEKYNLKVESAKKAGRKRSIDEEAIATLIRQGKTSS